jgi:hypothetical protein
MALSLKESQALTELADRLYPFLPGKPHPHADQSLSFPGVGAKLGLARHWAPGSKGPAITRLLTATLESERGRFCPLILAVVQHGMSYRMNKEPVSLVKTSSALTDVRVQDRRPAEPGAENQGFPRRTRF